MVWKLANLPVLLTHSWLSKLHFLQCRDNVSEETKLMLRSIPYTESHSGSERFKSVFAGWCRGRSYDAPAESLDRDPGSVWLSSTTSLPSTGGI